MDKLHIVVEIVIIYPWASIIALSIIRLKFSQDFRHKDKRVINAFPYMAFSHILLATAERLHLHCTMELVIRTLQSYSIFSISQQIVWKRNEGKIKYQKKSAQQVDTIQEHRFYASPLSGFCLYYAHRRYNKNLKFSLPFRNSCITFAYEK